LEIDTTSCETSVKGIRNMFI